MNELQNIIKNNAALLRSMNLDALYDRIPYNERILLTAALYAAGKNPLEHFKKEIYPYFAYKSSVVLHSDVSLDILNNIDIPNNIKTIGEGAFLANNFIGKISMSSVEDVNSLAFRDSTVHTVVFGNNLYKICYRAFANCSELSRIDLPFSVEIIEEGAFEGCYNLRSVHYGGTMEDWSYNRIYHSAFKGCPVSKVMCTDGVTDIYI